MEVQPLPAAQSLSRLDARTASRQCLVLAASYCAGTRLVFLQALLLVRLLHSLKVAGACNSIVLQQHFGH